MYYSKLWILYTGKFSDIKTLANLAIYSFSLKFQVANLVQHCNTTVQVSKFAQ